MKIGIITLPLHYNYGGILQAYALQKVIRDMGHEVYTINPPLNFARLKWPKGIWILFKRITKKYIFNKQEKIFKEQYQNKALPIICKETLSFVNKNIKLHRLKYFTALKETDYDAYIVGSDQIWRNYSVYDIEYCFLSFTKHWNVKRIAYAASFGVSYWQYSRTTTKHLKKYISLFDKVSVRETEAQALCKEYLNVEPEVMIDPTLLLLKDDYIKLIGNQPQSKGNMLCYILDDNKEKSSLISQIANDRSLSPFRVNSKVEDIFSPLEERIQPTIEQWLRGFYDAEFVITDSFHACVFSIIFGKPFVVFGNKHRGNSRFETLLNLFNLQKRLISTFDDYLLIRNDYLPITEINYTILSKREQAINFIKKGLNNVDVTKKD